MNKFLIKIIYILMLIPFFQIEYLKLANPLVSSIYNAWLYISIFVILILNLKKGKLSKMMILITIFEAILVISSVLNNVAVKVSITGAINVIFLCFLVEYGLKFDTKNFVSSFLFLLEILIFWNFLTILFYPNGMYTTKLQVFNWILGYDNSHIIYFITAFYISYINLNLKNNFLSKFRFYFLILISLLSVILRFSATSVIGYVLIILFIIFRKKFENSKILNLKNYFFVYLISFFSIVVFRLQNLFSFLIVDILEKDLTFTNRTVIWDMTFKFIGKKLILGHGIELSSIRSENYNFIYAVNSHDFLLEILYQGGIILLIVFLIMIFTLNNKIIKNNISNTILFVMFVLLLMMITEVFNIQYLFIMFIFLFNVDSILKNIKGDKNG